MTGHHSCLLFPFAAAITIFAGFAPSQQMVCFSVHDGPASGVDNQGVQSNLLAGIGPRGTDPVTWNIVAGRTASQVVDVLESQFNAKHYSVYRSSPEDLCVTAYPGGSPIWSGGYFGCTDTGLSTDMSIEARIQSVPETKGHGVGLVLPPGGSTVATNRPGQVHLDLEVERSGGRQVVPVDCNLPPGTVAGQVGQYLQQALQAAGFAAGAVAWQGTAPGQLLDGLCIDATLAGERVHDVRLTMDPVARQFFSVSLVAGAFPAAGATTFGVATQGSSTSMPFAMANGVFAPGGGFDVACHTGLPGRPGAILLNISAASPALTLLGGWILVNPAGAATRFSFTDNIGDIRCQWQIPLIPGLVGLPLFVQGGAIDLQLQASLTDGIAAVVGP